MSHFAFDVFLSFSSKDEELARPLYERLTQAGLRVFWSDESLKQRVGQSWYTEVGESLQTSRHLVLLWTERSAESKFVELEYQRFHSATIHDESRLLVPVLPPGVRSSSVPFMLGHLQCFSMEDDLNTLVSQLGGEVEVRSAEESQPVVSHQAESQPTPIPAEPGEKELTDEHGFQFVRIDPGTFMMGQEGIDGATPVHEVTLSRPFYLGIYTVTQAQWTAIMGTNPSRYPEGGNHPVEQVSWDLIQTFLSKLGSGYRLPTEAEWEYACRAGTTTKYSFGDNKQQLGAYAWHRQNSGTVHAPVGQKQPNPWGLYDMHGNVYEWVNDHFGDYEPGAVTDPAGPTSGTHQVIRSGSFSHFFKDLYSASRDRMRPNSKYSYLSFRLVKEIKPD